MLIFRSCLAEYKIFPIISAVDVKLERKLSSEKTVNSLGTAAEVIKTDRVGSSN